MTPEQLEDYILCGDDKGLVDAVTGLPEAERRKLSKAASGLLQQTRKAYTDSFRVEPQPQGIIKDIASLFARRQTDIERLLNHHQTAQLAAAALCPLSIVRRVDFHLRSGDQKAYLMRILTDRKPDWVDEWLDLQLRQQWPSVEWNDIDQLIHADVCSRPQSEGYIRLMVNDFPARYYQKKDSFIPLSQKLRDNPSLLENEVWRLFEVETTAFLSGWQYHDPEGPANYENWGMALVRLGNEKVIDRQRLIDGCFLGLTAGITNKNTLTGYIQFYDALETTDDEVISRQGKFMDLLSHSAAHVVSFAVKNIQQIDKLNKLDDEAFLRPAETLVLSRIQGQVKTTLTILSRIAKRQERLRKASLGILVQGIGHESAAIQEMTLRLVEPWLNEGPPEVLQTLRDCLDRVSPSLREKVQTLLAHFGGKPDTVETTTKSERETGNIEELKRRAGSLPEAIRNRAGVDSILKAIEEGGDYAPLDYDLYDAQVLSGLKPIQPIQSLEELIEAVSHAIEVVDSAEEVERILDGISRFGTERPDDFERQTGPLKKRIIENHGARSHTNLFGDWGRPMNMGTALLSWLGKEPERVKPVFDLYRPSPVDVLDERCYELAVRVHQQEAAPLVAMPTHRHGWIDPRVFVERLLYYQSQNIQLMKFDFLQALLRLAPDHRQEALEQAHLVEGKLGEIVRWALGGTLKPMKLMKEDIPVWITAGRARSPKEKLQKLEVFQEFMTCPDGITPALYTWKAFLKTKYDNRDKKEYHEPGLTVFNGFNFNQSWETVEVPQSMLHSRTRDGKYDYRHGYYATSSWLVHLIGMVWPQNTDPFNVGGIQKIFLRMDMNSSAFDPHFAYYEILFEPDRPLTEMGILLIWIGLAGKDADARGHAIDLLTEAIQDGRAHAGPLGETLVKLCAGGWVKLNRIGDALKGIARLSPLHAYVAGGVLRRWLAGQEKLPDDGQHLLAPLLEIAVRMGWSLTDAEKRSLAAVSGTSKTAKLAKELMRLERSKASAEERQALVQQLEARLRRGERWREALTGA
jgi:hypothetical protein